ncbi:MAG: bifunctional phosphoribosylaminoimidazolecarboxamide formyltransferase/IMP cyclohydrolase [Chloroflexota bacterium]|nr:bifunctional phosphoribosylaminoimidazolecarboxamide formyltransferase/IMP cyclohydrolase [Chloroflexota bacterium]
MRAILSVSNKHGIVEFARGLQELGFDLYSTGGTKRALSDAGVAVRSVSDLTGFPEILEGRVKTLHPNIHGGLLARRRVASDLEEIARHGIAPLDLVCVNLYPFAETVASPDVELEAALEQIDIGGPTLLRAAAKNHPDVIVVCDPADYDRVLAGLRDGGLDLAVRRQLAAKAFQHTAAYDTVIAHYLRGDAERFPQQLTIALEKVRTLRYGENPHQQAAFYRELSPAPRGLRITNARQLHGAELSFNNILDADAALSAVADFIAPTVAIVKHTNPCGLATRPILAEAYQRAFEGDMVSAYGGIVALNRAVDADTARLMAETFYEVIIAPAFTPEALAILKKKRNLRLLEVGDWLVQPTPRRPVAGDEWQRLVAEAHERSQPPAGHLPLEYDLRRVSGGLLVQTRDAVPVDPLDLKVVSARRPTLEELTDLLFAWRVCRHIKSNAIVLAKDLMMVGMGAGQPNRVTSVAIALERAGDRAPGSVLASDAFFPFPDGVERAAKGGVTAIIQPGGSIRDDEVIKTVNHYGMAMVFTGMRHFRH